MIGKLERMFVDYDTGSKTVVTTFKKAGLTGRTIRKNYKEICCWIMFLGILCVIYKFFSDGSFSAILTLSALFQWFGMILLLLNVLRNKNNAVLSLRSMILGMVAVSGRLLCNVKSHAYLPVDKSGDWVYQLADFATVVFLGVLIWVLMVQRKDAEVGHFDEADCIPFIPKLTLILPLGVSGILSTIIRPNLAGSVIYDFAWAFGLYTDTLSMVPQLFLMSRVGEVELLTGHYVASIAASKAIAFQFWIFSYKELNPVDGGFNLAGYAVLLTHFIQLALMADFMYHYIRSVRKGKKLILSL